MGGGEASLIFAEHFIEHLPYEAGLRFLRECRRILQKDGILRLSTPNLDWVWHVYHFGQWADSGEAVRDCFWLNKGFHGWGHRFLYNLPSLEATLRAAGFAEIAPRRYGESPHDALRGIERHEQTIDSPELPHVIVVEASGSTGETVSSVLEKARAEYDAAINER